MSGDIVMEDVRQRFEQYYPQYREQLNLVGVFDIETLRKPRENPFMTITARRDPKYVNVPMIHTNDMRIVGDLGFLQTHSVYQCLIAKYFISKKNGRRTFTTTR